LSYWRPSPWHTLAIVLPILALVAGVIQTGPGHSVLRALGLFADSGSYTAISFENPENLPHQLKSVKTTLKLAFEISNETTETEDYHWTSVVNQSHGSRQMKAGHVRLSPGRTASVALAFKLDCHDEQLEVSVGLAEPAEHIDAWFSCAA
jgi:hypothetical protein